MKDIKKQWIDRNAISRSIGASLRDIQRCQCGQIASCRLDDVSVCRECYDEQLAEARLDMFGVQL